MSKPDKPKKEYVPMYSQNFMTGYSFVHHALVAFTEAFVAGGKKP